MNGQTFTHTTLHNIEYGITNAFIMEFWSYLTDEISKSDLFDDEDRKALMTNKAFITQFLEDNESYIHQKVIKP